METLVDPSYTVVADCHFCGLPIPLNVFRGTVNGALNKLSLQKVHVIPSAFGDTSDRSNCHAYCLTLDHGYEWTDSALAKAKATITQLLSSPLDEKWIPKRGAFCLAEGCFNAATCGAYMEYCTHHSTDS